MKKNLSKFADGFVHVVSIDGSSKLTAKDLQIPSDISSAAFFIVAAACLENSEIVIENVGLNPTRTAIIEVLKNFGAEIEILGEREVCNEIIGNLRVSGKENLQPKNISNIIGGEIIANLIDEIPILAVFATKIEGGLEIRNAGELRVKESDRIAAVVENLRRMNARRRRICGWLSRRKIRTQRRENRFFRRPSDRDGFCGRRAFCRRRNGNHRRGKRGGFVSRIFRELAEVVNRLRSDKEIKMLFQETKNTK